MIELILRGSYDRRNAIQAINNLDLTKPQQVTIKQHQPTRKTKQNALYWKWLSVISKHIIDTTGAHYSTDDMHDYFRQLFLPQHTVEVNEVIVKARKSTAKLKVGEFAAYLEQIESYATDSLHCPLPHPDDLYWAAVMKDAAVAA